MKKYKLSHSDLPQGHDPIFGMDYMFWVFEGLVVSVSLIVVFLFFV